MEHSLTQVLYLYEFTLLSNGSSIMYIPLVVLYLYEFTLLSNGQYDIDREDMSLIPL